ncbi:hypothetical protein HID58_065972, partial [Brassica napus]
FGSRRFLTLYKSSSKDISHPPLPDKFSDSLQQLNIDFNLDFYGFPDKRRRDFRSSPSKIHTHTPQTGPTSEGQSIPRYFSDSDEDKTASSMDSTAPKSPPVEAVDDDSSTQLPTRLFAPGFFPTGLRLNIYSKANVIGAVASALAGSADMDVLLRPQFGRFLLPEAERHLWLDEVEDLQVTRLVHRLSSGHTFTTEDARTRGKQPENAPLPPEDKPEVEPIIHRNLWLLLLKT